MRPNLARTSSTMASTLSVSVMSQRVASVSTPNSEAISSATSWHFSRRRAQTTMLAPWLASALAICTPRPPEAPVTMATRPERSK